MDLEYHPSQMNYKGDELFANNELETPEIMKGCSILSSYANNTRFKIIYLFPDNLFSYRAHELLS